MGHRMVVVGERLRPGYTVDDAVRVAASIDRGSVLSVAVLDRPDGTTVVAVSVDAGEGSMDVMHACLVVDLGSVFSTVSVRERNSAPLAMDRRLT